MPPRVVRPAQGVAGRRRGQRHHQQDGREAEDAAQLADVDRPRPHGRVEQQRQRPLDLFAHQRGGREGRRQQQDARQEAVAEQAQDFERPGAAEVRQRRRSASGRGPAGAGQGQAELQGHRLAGAEHFEQFAADDRIHEAIRGRLQDPREHAGGDSGLTPLLPSSERATVMNASSRSVCTSRNCVTPSPAATRAGEQPGQLLLAPGGAEPDRRPRPATLLTSAPGSTCRRTTSTTRSICVGPRQQDLDRPLLAELAGDLVQRAQARRRPRVMMATR